MAFSFVPAGTILPFGGATAPSGWLLCNGASVAIASYPALSNAIGVLWGNPGGGSFNLPDGRGAFFRGIGTSGVHVGPATVGAVQSQATAKNGLNTQSDGTHSHSITLPTFGGYLQDSATVSNVGSIIGRSAVGNNDPSNSANWKAAATNDSAHNHGLGGDSETRPNSFGVNYIIKI